MTGHKIEGKEEEARNGAMHAICSNASLSSLSSEQILERICEIDTKTQSLLQETTTLQSQGEGLLETLGSPEVGILPVVGPGTRNPSLHRDPGGLERALVIEDIMDDAREKLGRVRREYGGLVRESLEVRAVVDMHDREVMRCVREGEERLMGLRVRLEGVERIVGM